MDVETLSAHDTCKDKTDDTEAQDKEERNLRCENLCIDIRRTKPHPRTPHAPTQPARPAYTACPPCLTIGSSPARRRALRPRTTKAPITTTTHRILLALGIIASHSLGIPKPPSTCTSSRGARAQCYFSVLGSCLCAYLSAVIVSAVPSVIFTANLSLGLAKLDMTLLYESVLASVYMENRQL